MENVEYFGIKKLNVGQKVVVKSEYQDHITGAEIEYCKRVHYGFISHVTIDVIKYKDDDGSYRFFESAFYTVLVMRSEIDTKVSFYDGFQSDEKRTSNTINFPWNEISFEHDDLTMDFQYEAVKEFNYKHEKGLFL